MRNYSFITIDAHFQRCLNWAWLLRNQLLLLLVVERCLDSTERRAGVSIRRVVQSAAGMSCDEKEQKMRAKPNHIGLDWQ